MKNLTPRLSRIWYLVPRMGLGGSEKHILNLASGLKQKGYETGIVCLFAEGALAGEVRQKNIPLVSLGLKGWTPHTLFQIYKWLKKNPTDILHTYLFGFHLFAGLPARILGVPVILSSRRELAEWQKIGHRILERLGNFFVDRVVCCSQAVQKRTLEKEGIGANRVLTLYNGVDLARFQPKGEGSRIRKEFAIPPDSPLVGTVANFGVEKGYTYLLEAAQLVLQRVPNARFLIVGSGPLEEKIRKQAAGMTHADQIIFAGTRTDIPAILDSLDVFVLASEREGLPNAILEAMAMGKPIVATSVGGIPELIRSGEEGILVPPKDSNTLAQAVIRLLDTPEKAREMGLKAQDKARNHFSMDRMIDNYEKLYLELLEKAETKDRRLKT